MTEGQPTVEVVMPVHNEASTIEETIREALEAMCAATDVAVIACEDGSSDGTPDVLDALARSLPIKLITSPDRKGYSGAVLDGMRALEADYLVAMDSDGQIDPRDFVKFWERRDQADLVVGRRTPRQDPAWRRAMSRSFYLPYRVIFNVPLRDPSCPMVLARRDVIEAIVPPRTHVVEGFWWEFYARAAAAGCRFAEVPIAHRLRKAGTTQVYRPRKLIGIGARHAAAMARLKAELRSTSGRVPTRSN